MNSSSLSGDFVDQVNDPDSAYNLCKAVPNANAVDRSVQRRPAGVGEARADGLKKRASGNYGFLDPDSNVDAGQGKEEPIGEDDADDNGAYNTMSHTNVAAAVAARVPTCPDPKLEMVLKSAGVHSIAWPKLHAEQIDDVATLRSLERSDLVSIGLSSSEVNAIQSQLRLGSQGSSSSARSSSAGNNGTTVAAATALSGGLRVKAQIAGALVDMANDPDSVYHTMPADDGADDDEEFNGFDSDEVDF